MTLPLLPWSRCRQSGPLAASWRKPGPESESCSQNSQQRRVQLDSGAAIEPVTGRLSCQLVGPGGLWYLLLLILTVSVAADRYRSALSLPSYETTASYSTVIMSDVLIRSQWVATVRSLYWAFIGFSLCWPAAWRMDLYRTERLYEALNVNKCRYPDWICRFFHSELQSGILLKYHRDVVHSEKIINLELNRKSNAAV